jgi:glycoside/pentoside/hexuronide:cation symporter, GPH family
MLAEVCDLDEIENGTRREGVFTAMFNWGNKFSMAFVSMLGGSMIDLSGFRGSLTTQSPETISFLRWVFAVGPIPFLLLAIYFTIKFPLNSTLIKNMKEAKEISC